MVAMDHTLPVGKSSVRPALIIAAIGVVFGDIGTSPLYALRECFNATHGLQRDPETVIGVVSLMFWVLTLVVCVKYLAIVVRADNRGEGGILQLISLVGQKIKDKKGQPILFLSLLGIIGASLLYSDGMLTPSVSVLSAVEGLTILTPAFEPWIVPITLAILIGLFSFQSFGTAKVGRLFGPIIAIWFVVLGILGVSSISHNPAILAALNPVHAFRFLINHGSHSFGVLGSVFLAITGAEVMYADLGHFGRRPIRIAWFFLIFPCLVLNYAGQGALLLNPAIPVDNLFFMLSPEWFKLPLIILATFATIIASQAVITGAFSLARASVQLGFWPRLQVRHTSSETIGQVYVPFINWLLMLGTIGLVLGFKASANLANAYGIAVSADMLITTGLMAVVALKIWKAHPLIVFPIVGFFAVLDGTLFVSNASKIVSGGWIVVIFAFSLFMIMKTWMDGRKLVKRELENTQLSLETFIESIQLHMPTRVKGTAVFLAGNPNGVPVALLHNLKHNRVLHDTTVILSIQNAGIPVVPDYERSTHMNYEQGIWRVTLHYGFSETPDVPKALSALGIPGLTFDPMQTTYFLGRESLVPVFKKHTMWLARKRLFTFLSHNALNASLFFKLPPNRVVEVGTRTEF